MNEKTKTLAIRAIEGQIMPEEETYQARLRAAVFDGITDADVAAVVKGIVKKAKDGDAASQKIFFDYLLGQKVKPTKIEVHNHFPDVESAARAERFKRSS